MPIELPTSMLPITRVSPKLLFIYGQPKVGKTEALAKLCQQLQERNLPNNLIIQCDPGGADFVSAYKVQVNSLAEVNEVTTEIMKRGKPYKFVSVDTTTELEKWCEDDATEEYKKSVIGKNFKGESVLMLPEGAGYLHLRHSFQKYMAKIMQCADHVICTGHIKDKFIGKKEGKDVSALDIDHTGQIKRMICAGADTIGYLYRVTKPSAKANEPGEDILKISFQTKEAINCGTRAKYLAGKDFEMDWSIIYPDVLG